VPAAGRGERFRTARDRRLQRAVLEGFGSNVGVVMRGAIATRPWVLGDTAGHTRDQALRRIEATLERQASWAPGTGERPEGARCGVEDHVCRCLGRSDGDRVRSTRDLAASVRQLSPGSGANPVTYTSALISSASASTFEITAPP
jgi:hypothetical protein